MQSTNDKPKCLICFAADERYSFPLGVTIHSMLTKTSTPLQIAVFDGGLSNASKNILTRLVEHFRSEIEFKVPLMGTWNRQVLNRHQTTATYIRIEMPLHFPDRASLIYCDCDLLFRDDISKLPSPATGHVLAAVRDISINNSSHLIGSIAQESTICFDKPYFAAGVLNINCREYISHRIADQCIDYLNSAKRPFPYVDQDVLNVAASGMWTEIPDRWNVHLNALWCRHDLATTHQESLRNPGILHFTGPRKPWNLARPRIQRVQWISAAMKYYFGFVIGRRRSVQNTK
jgi:lipopolysaccharide biosynthesis glycosyltransferase